ncbi:glycoside hydrolase family 10 protein [Apibacter mensalis]|uniref:glycoside hydrolase family 10 protein n=1 Tax=Apibacter mensalis TaxID=1586267 RepID=UPI0026F04FAF|nr:family 10 glycosylhydrolase [Apibacter mensalis]
MKSKKLFLIVAHFLSLTLIFAGTNEPVEEENEEKNNKEFRAVWVATFLNIDWPSKPGLPAEQQKEEFITLLENVKKWKMNAIIVQVKPASDALYPSKLSPWSGYLSGTQGVDPGYDPLEFMVKEAHKRDIEIHAWFNPFRLSAANANWSSLATDNIAFKHPNWVVRYANQLYLNPGLPEVRDYVIQSIMEVVNNYEVDGIHLDDYFYPYKVGKLDYPDFTAYTKYGVTFASKADWRRDNINTFVQKLYKSIKSKNKDIEFGISPFGVWRNQNNDPLGSKTKALQNYDDLYADVLLWMRKGWLNYIAPQLYWHRGHNLADYATLVEWWSSMAKETDTKLYIGMAAYRVNQWKNPNELVEQVYYNREFPEVKGSIFFSYKSLVNDPKGVLTNLISGPFAE